MTWWSRLLRRNKLEQDLGRELQFHIEERIFALKSTGLSESEARRRVRQEFGGIEQVKEECRDARGISFVDNLSRDLRYAIRILRRAPLFTAAAVGILALGIGANTTVFTFIENILLRPLPVPEPEKLVSLNWGDSGDSLSMSYPNYVDFRDRNTAFPTL